MTAIEVLHAVERAGGSLALKAGGIKFTIPKRAMWLVPELKRNRNELIGLLSGVNTPLLLPSGVRLLKWEPKIPPVAIVRLGIVGNVEKFIEATLRELQARMEGKEFRAGNWSIRELVDRLEQVGMEVEVTKAQD